MDFVFKNEHIQDGFEFLMAVFCVSYGVKGPYFGMNVLKLSCRRHTLASCISFLHLQLLCSVICKGMEFLVMN